VIEDLTPGEWKCALTGVLTVKDRSHQVDAKGKCHRENDKWTVEGEAGVNMKDYGIEPPSIAFITMNPVVTVGYKLVFVRGTRNESPNPSRR
jgi:hypothetical protein